ncbi:hypothetical protein DMENIID0001_055710 [Sergentomyia squamirostris]
MVTDKERCEEEYQQLRAKLVEKFALALRASNLLDDLNCYYNHGLHEVVKQHAMMNREMLTFQPIRDFLDQKKIYVDGLEEKVEEVRAETKKWEKIVNDLKDVSAELDVKTEQMTKKLEYANREKARLAKELGLGETWDLKARKAELLKKQEETNRELQGKIQIRKRLQKKYEDLQMNNKEMDVKLKEAEEKLKKMELKKKVVQKEKTDLLDRKSKRQERKMRRLETVVETYGKTKKVDQKIKETKEEVLEKERSFLEKKSILLEENERLNQVLEEQGKMRQKLEEEVKKLKQDLEMMDLNSRGEKSIPELQMELENLQLENAEFEKEHPHLLDAREVSDEETDSDSDINVNIGVSPQHSQRSNYSRANSFNSQNFSFDSGNRQNSEDDDDAISSTHRE